MWRFHAAALQPDQGFLDQIMRKNRNFDITDVMRRINASDIILDGVELKRFRQFGDLYSVTVLIFAGTGHNLFFLQNSQNLCH